MMYNIHKELIEGGAVNIPWMGGTQKEMLKDIALATGATYIDSKNPYVQLKDLTIDHLGGAKKIVIDAYQTSIVEGYGEEKVIKRRTDQLQSLIEQEKRPRSQYFLKVVSNIYILIYINIYIYIYRRD